MSIEERDRGKKPPLCFRGHEMHVVIDPEQTPEMRKEMARMGFLLDPHIRYCPTCNPELVAKYEPTVALTPLDAKLNHLFGPRPPDLPNPRRKQSKCSKCGQEITAMKTVGRNSYWYLPAHKNRLTDKPCRFGRPIFEDANMTQTKREEKIL